MTIVALIDLLRQWTRDHDKRVFSLSELSRLSGESPAALGMTLHRAHGKKVVSRVGNLWINMVDPPSPETLALALRTPSYISFESALYQRGILSQSPRGALTVATTGRPCSFKTPLGAIRFLHLKQELFFGFDAHRIAYPEKAWLDLLYMRQRKGIPLQETWYAGSLQKKRLREYAAHFPKTRGLRNLRGL